MKSFLAKFIGWCLMIGLVGMVGGCENIPVLDDQDNRDTNYVPCTSASQCEKNQTCDTSQCLSCCPNSTGACIDLCCGKCVPGPIACTTDADCAHGFVCEPASPGVCDDSSKRCVLGCHQESDCDANETCNILYCFTCPCPGQCQAKPYVPCTNVEQCSPGEKCDNSGCLSCCPNSTGPCIDLCCGKCVSGFCGWSTNGPCAGDADCMTGGCSGQVCQSTSEGPIITTCEWTDCYSAKAYGVSCGCVDNQCTWM